jgi:SAM-dependent methyltransferase
VSQLYDSIGVEYARHRRPDPRIAGAIRRAVGGAASVVNVGARTGSYEPDGRPVVAVEPSMAMIRQRRAGGPRVVQGVAGDLPFRAGAFGAAMAVLTVHHWPDRGRGLAELTRVSRDRVVLVTWDPEARGFWLVEDYLPEILAIDRPIFPPMDELRRVWSRVDVAPILVPHDCVDGFLGAYWRRPRAYLDAGARAAISAFAKVGGVAGALDRLGRDLADGTWERRHGHVMSRTEMDLGYRLVVADLRGGGTA